MLRRRERKWVVQAIIIVWSGRSRADIYMDNLSFIAVS